MDPTPPSTHVLRVLIVEDYDDARESLCLLIRMWGYNCQTAADGPAALRVAAEFLPNVVLMDIGLPHMDGYEAARAMRKLPGMSGAAFIAVTGFIHLARQADDDFLAYLLKPADLDDLRERLDLCLTRRAAPTPVAAAAVMSPCLTPQADGACL